MTSLALFLAVALACHVLFSFLGFNPTDHGFILAGARRLLEGQIPHRDFITVRPAGSLLLHVPTLWWGGDAALWAGRGVAWFELAATAWMWTSLVLRAMARAAPGALRIAVAAVAFFLSAHTFPLMAWHTIDALFLVAAGITLCHSPDASRGRRIVGWFLIGFAPLCRQNFLAVVPAAIFLLGHGRRLESWLVSAFPGALYALFILSSGGLEDALLQLRTHGGEEAWRSGVTRFLENRGHLAGLATGALAACLAILASRLDRFAPVVRSASGLVLVAVVMLAAFALPPGWIDYRDGAAFLLFGATLATVIVLTVRDGLADPSVRLGFLVCVVAWTTAVSIGYPSPALAAGTLAAFLLGVATRWGTGDRTSAALPVTIIVALVTAANFSFARVTSIYRDAPAPHLVERVGDLLPGAERLRSNPRIRLFLEELGDVEARAAARGKRLVVLPDFAAWWVRNDEANLLPVDWALDIELARPELVERAVDVLRRHRGSIVVAVQKFETSRAAFRLERIPPERYALVDFVRESFRRTGETLLFEEYE